MAGSRLRLPARWRPWQRRKNTAIYLAVRLVVAALRRLPQRFRAALASALAPVAWALAQKQRRTAERQLAHALPHLPRRAQRRLVRQMFRHLARCAFELLDLPQLLAQNRLDVASERVLRDALAEGRGVVAVSGHIGNWELLAQAVAFAGLPLTVMAKPLYDPRLTAWMDQERRQFGAKVIWRGEQDSGRELLRALRNKSILALLLDQDTRVEGVFAPFFGRPAHTPAAAATLALRLGAPLVFGYSRTHNGGHSFHFERLEVTKLLAGVAEADRVVALTCALNAKLEGAIRAAPAQWVWLHRRWRQVPTATPTARGAAPRPWAAALVLLGLGLGLALGGTAQAQRGRPASPATAVPRQVAFRCDGMEIDERHHTGSCTGNVVLREGNTLLCCDAFVGQADATWQWQRFRCSGAVRVQQQDSAAWAERADGELAQGLLTLVGEPLLQRGQSLLQGDAIRLWQVSGSAEIDRPRGQMHGETLQKKPPAAGATPAWRTGPLPQRCPLPPAPKL